MRLHARTEDAMRLADAPGPKPWKKTVMNREKLVAAAKIAPRNLLRLARFVGVRPLGCDCRDRGRGPCPYCAAYLVDTIDHKIKES